MSLAELVKESLIFLARHTIGEARTHDYLIRRGIKVRQLENYYKDNGVLKPIHHGNERQTLIFMVDGKWMHGGLTDRLRGMASAWDFAKQHHLDFKIFHTSPFALDKILEPNKSDWLIKENEISWNVNDAKPVLLYREDFENIHVLERQLDKTHRQFHLYSCVDSVGEKFPALFNELFKPSELLQNELGLYEFLTKVPYGAISFRMQNLLGDFSEGKFGTLPSNRQKEELLNSALTALSRMISQNQQWDRILVTADSPALLEQAAKNPKVVTVKGKSVHIDFDKSNAEQDHLKAFVEFLLISKAQKVFLYQNQKYKTYPSNFPKYAAKLGNVPFETIKDC